MWFRVTFPPFTTPRMRGAEGQAPYGAPRKWGVIR